VSTIDEVTARRLAMLANGYAPLPVIGKMPPLNGWPTIAIDEAAIQSWGDPSTWRAGTPMSTGARTGETVALDVDIRDDAMAVTIEKLVHAKFGNGGGRLMRRIGMPPKRAFLFRTDAPFEKIQESFKAPSDRDDDKPHKIEVLGRGQHIVVDGIHPDTGSPYEWSGGEPWTVPRSELPKLSQATAAGLVGEIARLVLGTPGWRLARQQQSAGDGAQQQGADDSLIVQLATRLWGPGRHVAYSSGEWRFGTNGSKSVDAMARQWFDFEANEGGGMRELRAKVTAQAGADAPAEPPKIAVFKHGEMAPSPGPQLTYNRLPEVGKGLLSGQWGTFKTFMFLDMSCSIMLGGQWTNSPVYRQGGILLFAPEGAGGIPLRLQAMIENTLPGVVDGCRDLPKTLTPKSVDPKRLPFEWTNFCPPLLGAADPLPAMTAMAAAAHERFEREFGLPLVMIGIDTMSAASNSTKEEDNAEWARIMAMLETFSKMTGTAVVGVDHYGKNQEAGTRGASAKEANADFVLSTLGERALSGEVRNTRLALRKLRDGPQGIEFPFSGRLVDMGVDHHGQAVTSRVIDWSAVRARRKTLTETMLEAALATAVREHGETIRVEGEEVRAARTDWVRREFKQLYLATRPEGATSNAVKLAFKRAREGADGVGVQGDFMYSEEVPM
jgi:hypothetical protein